MKNFKKFVYPLLSLILLASPMIVLAGGFDPRMLITLGLPMGASHSIMENVMKWLLGIVGFISIIGFAIAGIIYFVAAGDEDLAKRAKRAMFYSIAGVIVALMGGVIWKAAQRMLDAKSNF